MPLLYITDVGAIHEFSIRVNNEPPVIKISGIDYAVEDDIWHTFDATLTEDPYWGRTDMYYVWTLRRPSHSGALPIDVKMGEDLNTYSLSGTQSGNYTLSLTVYDKGGLSSEQMVIFDIKNTVPTASLIIDGEQILVMGVLQGFLYLQVEVDRRVIDVILLPNHIILIYLLLG